MTTQNHDDDFLPEELQQLKALPREASPPEWMQSRIVQRLKQERLIKSDSVLNRYKTAIAIAASLFLICTGYLAGQRIGRHVSAPAHPLFVLLLLEDKNTFTAGPGHVSEYGHWIGDIRKSGRVATGEKLQDDGRLMHLEAGQLRIRDISTREPQLALGGYFVIEATDYQEALRIASQCPHLKYGGWIELRQIDKT